MDKKRPEMTEKGLKRTKQTKIVRKRPNRTKMDSNWTRKDKPQMNLNWT